LATENPASVEQYRRRKFLTDFENETNGKEAEAGWRGCEKGDDGKERCTREYVHLTFLAQLTRSSSRATVYSAAVSSLPLA